MRVIKKEYPVNFTYKIEISRREVQEIVDMYYRLFRYMNCEQRESGLLSEFEQVLLSDDYENQT